MVKCGIQNTWSTVTLLFQLHEYVLLNLAVSVPLTGCLNYNNDDNGMWVEFISVMKAFCLSICTIVSQHIVSPVGPFKDCLEAVEGGYTNSGMFLLKPDKTNRLMQVWCDQTRDPGGWTVIQRRTDGSVNFFRNWETYKVLIVDRILDSS